MRLLRVCARVCVSSYKKACVAANCAECQFPAICTKCAEGLESRDCGERRRRTSNETDVVGPLAANSCSTVVLGA